MNLPLLLAPSIAVAAAVLIYGRTKPWAWLALLAIVVVPTIILIVSAYVAFASIGALISGDRILSASLTLMPAYGAVVAFTALLLRPPPTERFRWLPWLPAGVLLLLLTAEVTASIVSDSIPRNWGIPLDWFFEVKSGRVFTTPIMLAERAVDVLVGAVLLLVLAMVASQKLRATRPFAFGTAAVFAMLCASLVLHAAEAAEGAGDVGFDRTTLELTDTANFYYLADVGYAITVVLVAIGLVFAFLATRSALQSVKLERGSVSVVS